MTAPEPRHYRTSSGGIQVAVERWPATGPGPHLLLAHATGFCQEVWGPFVAELDRLGPRGAVTTFDQRAHGASERSEHPFDWQHLADDALAAIADVDGPIVGVGHSSGGALLVLAEQAQPRRFSGLVLIEPIVFPPPHGRHEDSPLAAGTLRRRSRFASVAEARSNFEGKGPFARWRPDVLDAYLHGGLEPVDRGVELACDPRDEAEFYRTGATHQAWNHLPHLPPTVLMAGADSTTHPPSFVEALAAQMPEPKVVIVPDATHFLPMERPDLVAATVSGLMAEVAVSGGVGGAAEPGYEASQG